jgi:hypothetical protein
VEKGKAAASVSRVEERVAKALRRRLVFSSDDDDEMNDTPAEAAKRSLIRRRKNLRLIEKKKLDAEAKDSVMAPSDSLPANRWLSKHHDFLSVLIFLMDLEELVVRKEWGSTLRCGSSDNSRRGQRHTPPSMSTSSPAKIYSSTPM